MVVWNLAAERLLGITETEAVGQTLWTLHVPAPTRSTLQRVRKTLAEKRPLRAEETDYELPTGARGAVLIFADITKPAMLQRQLTSALKDNNGKAARQRK